MKTPSDLTSSMLASIRRFSMIEKGDRILAAVSGGPDSVALLHSLWTLRDKLGVTIHVAHLNHSFRGEDSDTDAEYVAELSRNLGLTCTVEKIDVPQIQKALRLSPEEAARMVRHEFLGRTADMVGADRIALGHTADDQVETVILNILRGTGVDGLSGMPPVRDRLIRPLIETRRIEVEEYIIRNDLHPRTDITNLQPDYTRNKVRLELLPLLRMEYNREIDNGILRLSELARDESAYLCNEAINKLACSKTEISENSVKLDISKLQIIPSALKRRMIREAIRDIQHDIVDIGFIHIESILKLLDSGTDFDYNLPRGIFVRRKGNNLTISLGKPNAEPIIYCYELSVPGKTHISEIDAIVETQVSKLPLDPVRPPGNMESVIDYRKISGELRVRSWKPGDRIQPLGMTGSKKVQDIFVDAKVPREARDRVPIIEDDDKIVWVAGFVLSGLVKVSASTREFLLIEITSP